VIKDFQRRHIGPSASEAEYMLNQIGSSSLDQLIQDTLPTDIIETHLDGIPGAMTEHEYLNHIRELSLKNRVFKNYIGQGYAKSITPSPILRNIFHNPGWYTQYTPYQAEIAQGRLEALLNFQTIVSELTGMPVANASLLDEGTAAAEAMIMFYNLKNKRVKGEPISKFLIDEHTHAHVIDVIKTRAQTLGIECIVQSYKDFDMNEEIFGVLLQYPNALGAIEDYSEVISRAQEANVFTCIDADILSLTLLQEPGAWGVDAVVGNTQRLGIPMGFGGPYAAYFATLEKYKRSIPRSYHRSICRSTRESSTAHGIADARATHQTREGHFP